MYGRSLRPAAALLSKKALKYNLSQIKKQVRSQATLHSPRSEVMAVVKADAYGHDLGLILPELGRLGLRHFAVATLEEAIEARRLSKSAKILVLGGTFKWTDKTVQLVKSLRVDVAVNDLSALKVFIKHPKVPIHLKLDTGMNRLGLKPDAWDQAVRLLRKNNRKLDGLFTHYATISNAAFNRQVLLFESAVNWFLAQGFKPKWIHSENSSSMFSKNSCRKGILSRVSNIVRPGLSLYGYHPRGTISKVKLSPVLELVSDIVLVKDIKKGEGMSYGHLYKAATNHEYGVVPVGYADGVAKEYLSHLRPEWRTKANKSKGPLNICGAICMDMFMVRASRGRFKAAEKVALWGRFSNPLISKNIVEAYELNLRVSKRVPRVWVS